MSNLILGFWLNLGWEEGKGLLGNMSHNVQQGSSCCQEYTVELLAKPGVWLHPHNVKTVSVITKINKRDGDFFFPLKKIVEYCGEHRFQSGIEAGTPEKNDALIAAQSKSLAWQELLRMCLLGRGGGGGWGAHNFASGWNAPGCIVKE